MALYICGNGFDRPFVHPFRTDIPPVLVELVIGHRLFAGALLVLQELLCPFPDPGIPIHGRACCVHADRLTHERCPPSRKSISSGNDTSFTIHGSRRKPVVERRPSEEMSSEEAMKH